VIDPHFVAFSSSLYTTIYNPKPNPNPNSNPDPNPNPTVITDLQLGPRDPQIVTVRIRPAPHFVVCPLSAHIGYTTSYAYEIYIV